MTFAKKNIFQKKLFLKSLSISRLNIIIITFDYFNQLKTNVAIIIVETSQLTYNENQLTGFHILTILALHRLNVSCTLPSWMIGVFVTSSARI